ncbi:MAG: phosphoribosylanthranilate isomerase [Candidatus Acidiferrales bacterium]
MRKTMVRVKICGITNWTDARLSVDAGADALGFNFFEKSPRYIAPADARTIVGRLPRRIFTVGVFVNSEVADVLRIASDVDLNALQLHGDESPANVRRLSEYYPVMKAFRIRRGFDVKRLARFDSADLFLLDGFDRQQRGGTGQTFDWRIGRAAKKYGRIVIAGGLTPENVADAIAATDPFAVDICSGVEASPGKKDRQRLYALMDAVRSGREHLA